MRKVHFKELKFDDFLVDNMVNKERNERYIKGHITNMSNSVESQLEETEGAANSVAVEIASRLEDEAEQYIDISDRLSSGAKDIMGWFQSLDEKSDGNKLPNEFLRSASKVLELLEDEFNTANLGSRKLWKCTKIISSFNSIASLFTSLYSLCDSIVKINEQSMNGGNHTDVKDRVFETYYWSKAAVLAESVFLFTPLSVKQFDFAWKGVRWINNNVIYRLGNYSRFLQSFVMSRMHFTLRGATYPQFWRAVFNDEEEILKEYSGVEIFDYLLAIVPHRIRVKNVDKDYEESLFDSIIDELEYILGSLIPQVEPIPQILNDLEGISESEVVDDLSDFDLFQSAEAQIESLEDLSLAEDVAEFSIYGISLEDISNKLSKAAYDFLDGEFYYEILQFISSLLASDKDLTQPIFTE